MRNKIWHLFEKCAGTALKLAFKLAKKDLTDGIFDAFMQFARFGAVGVSNTVVSYIVYIASLTGFRRLGILPDAGYLAAQAVAFVLGVLWSFYWNSRLVFTLKEGEERSLVSSLIKTFISYSFTGLFLNTALLVLWVRALHISEFIAPLINLLVSVPVNFAINKFWAFGKK